MRKSLNISTYVSSIDTYVDMLSDLRILVFGTFLKLAMHVQTSRSQRLFNGFQSFLVQNEGEVLLVSFLDFTVSCFHLTWTKTSGEAKNYDFSKYFFSLCTNPESEIMTCRAMKNGKLTHIYPSHNLFLFCILLKLYTTKFQSKRSSLRCDPLEQVKLPGMKMLTRDSGY